MTFWSLKFSKKNNEKNWQISALEFKKWSDQQNKGTSCNTTIYISNVLKTLLPSSYDLTTFFVVFLERHFGRHSEINRPLIEGTQKISSHTQILYVLCADQKPTYQATVG